MPLQLLEVGFHVEIHAIEWHDFQRETQIHGVVVACIEFSLISYVAVSKYGVKAPCLYGHSVEH